MFVDQFCSDQSVFQLYLPKFANLSYCVLKFYPNSSELRHVSPLNGMDIPHQFTMEQYISNPSLARGNKTQRYESLNKIIDPSSPIYQSFLNTIKKQELEKRKSAKAILAQ